MANGQGVGFARLIEQQLGRNMQAAAAPTTEGSDDASATLPPAIRAGNALPLTASDLRHMQSSLQAYRNQAASASAVAGQAAANVPAAGGEAASPGAKEFVSQVWPHAVEASRATGIPPQFLVAQAALESGWGKSEIRRADGSGTFNLFGIKAGKSWNGAVVEAPTTEYVDGQAQRVTEKFRAYGSYAEAFRDYANLLRNNPRYGNVVGSQDGTEFAKRLQQAGYATDPAYADKLARIINGPVLRQALIG
jgi:flagellar protein FlgJ